MSLQASWSLEFANDGGPLIVLPRELLGAWRGVDGPVEEDCIFGPDYERACDAAHPADLLAVGRGFGLVIGAQDQVATAQWLRLPGASWVGLVGWGYADPGSEQNVLDLLRDDGLAWHRFESAVDLIQGELLLFHAGTPGDEISEGPPFEREYAVIGDALPLRLGPGKHAVEWLELGGALGRDPFGCVLCRWVPITG